MRVCPKCGHIDPAYWRHSGFNRWYDFTRLENFKIMVDEGHYPTELLDELLKNKKAEGKDNVFRLSKGGYVYRLCKLDADWMKKFHSAGEKPKDPFQKKLGEACVAGDNKP